MSWRLFTFSECLLLGKTEICSNETLITFSAMDTNVVYQR